MKNFKLLTPFLIGISVSIIFWSFVSLYLTKTPTIYIPERKFFDFYKINLTNLFFSTNKNINNKKSITPETLPILNNVKLKAIYENGKNSFIIVEYKNKTHFIYLKENFNGYTLEKVNKESAIFVKNGKKFVVSFKKIKSHINKANSNTNTYTIPKKTFYQYKTNLKKIWTNIRINKTLNGYKITYIKKGSIFDKIGLKRGDILIEVNGRKLNSDADAWDLYRNIDKFNYFEIKLKRNNKIKVLNYEIN